MRAQPFLIHGWRVFAALFLVAGMVTAGAEAGAASSPRALKAPVGVWSGTGDNPAEFDDYTVVAVMPGPAGSQPAFFGEYVAFSHCDGGQLAMLGTAGFAGGFVTISGDLVCVGTGNTIGHVEFRFEYDAATDTLTGVDWVFDGNVFDLTYPDPFTRKCTGNGNTIVGTSGNDALVGTAGHDVIDGRGGNDTLEGLGGIDILCGQSGKDKLIGGDHIDVLVGGSGKDTLEGGTGPDLLLGGGGKDMLKGQAGDDAMFGAAGKDTLDGEDGDDYANGGGGTDTCTAETTVSC